jgi:hypothetical protein
MRFIIKSCIELKWTPGPKERTWHGNQMTKEVLTGVPMSGKSLLFINDVINNRWGVMRRNKWVRT